MRFRFREHLRGGVPLGKPAVQGLRVQHRRVIRLLGVGGIDPSRKLGDPLLEGGHQRREFSGAGPGLGSPGAHVELVREREQAPVRFVDCFGARVEREAAGLDSPHPPPDALPCLENDNVGSRLHEAIGSGEAGEPRPDDGDPP